MVQNWGNEITLRVEILTLLVLMKDRCRLERQLSKKNLEGRVDARGVSCCWYETRERSYRAATD